MTKTNYRELALVIFLLWIVGTCVVSLGWIVTADKTHDEWDRVTLAHDGTWDNMVKIGAVGAFILGFVAIIAPSGKGC